MYRWLAYYGHPIYLDEVLFKPENSLIQQSLHARWTRSVTNGDGFGVGWYGERPEPGLFRDVLPAWNDDNLLSLSGQIRSALFFAHVRASTGTATAQANCHPLRAGRSTRASPTRSTAGAPAPRTARQSSCCCSPTAWTTTRWAPSPPPWPRSRR